MSEETTSEQLAEIEGQGDTVQNGLVRDFTHQLEESGVLDLTKAEQQIEELRSEVSYVQNLLGTERRRVTELEELVGSLRTINEAQEKAFTAAGKENTALRNQLAAVASVAADRQRLLSELDAAQQVPQPIADRFEEGWNQGTARAIETVIAWLEPIRLADSAYLANATMQHLPSIMRHLTGLAQD